MILAILVFVIFASGTAALAGKTGGGRGRSSRGRLGGSKSRGFGKGRGGGGRSRSSGSGRSRTGGTSRSTASGRTGRAGGSRTARTSIGRGSWFFKAWNSSGAPKTSETSFRGASAVLTGKAAGAGVRGGWWVSKKTGRGGRWFAATTLIPFDKWLERKRVGMENAADLNAATPTPDNTEPRFGGDVVHDADPPREPKLDTRTIDDFTAEDLWTTPRGRLALNEHRLKEMTAAFQNLKAAGHVDAEVEAEHMANRRRVESEIAGLRQALNIRTTPEPARTPPPVFVKPKNPTRGETPVETNLDRSAVPPTLAPHLNHVHDFEPENDADLLNMLSAEVHGMHSYAEATSAMFDNCVTGKGLDPSAMQGVSEYADAFTEAAETIARAHQQFLAVYEAIIEAANNGTQMPYNGRFFSGEAAA